MTNQQSFLRLLNEDHSTAERMAYIDFRLRFTGMVNRADLKSVFGLAEAASSKAMSAYGKKCPDNMNYDRVLRANAIKRESFTPLFAIDADTALEMLSCGFDKSKLINSPMLPYSRIGRVPKQLDTNAVAIATRAMSGGYAIRCNYLSENSDNHSTRILIPVSILFDGRFWIFRAYDRGDGKSEGRFKNFHFTRAINVEELIDDRRLNHEELENDKAWNTQIPLLLKLHDDLKNPDRQRIRTDFGLEEGKDELLVTERNAVLWVLFKQWFIDARSLEKIAEEEKEGISRFYKFKLMNRDMVEMLKNQ